MKNNITRRVLSIWLLSLGALLQPSAQATLLLYEGFDYTPGSALHGLNGGTGFSGAWANTSANNYSISAGSLDNSAFPPDMLSGNKVGAPVTGASTASRTFSAINMDVAGVFYFSVLMTKTVTGEATDTSAFMTFRSGGTDKVGVSFGNNDRFRIRANTSNTSITDAGFVVADEVYFLVGKVETSATTDTISLMVYKPGDSMPTFDEPAVWTGSVSATITGSIDNIALIKGTATGASFDEIRLGQTWQDVAAIPEASTLLFLSSFMGLLLIVRLRNRR